MCGADVTSDIYYWLASPLRRWYISWTVSGGCWGDPCFSLSFGTRCSGGSYSDVGRSLASLLKDAPPGPSLASFSSNLETQQGTINHKSTQNENAAQWGGHMVGKTWVDREAGRVAEEGRQRGPSDTCHSPIGLWTSAAGWVTAQHHSALVFGWLSRMGDHSPGADLQDLW